MQSAEYLAEGHGLPRGLTVAKRDLAFANLNSGENCSCASLIAAPACRCSRPPPSPRPAKPGLTAAAARRDARDVRTCHQHADRDRAPSKCRRWRNIVADQFKAAGFPAADVHVMPYHTGSATTGEDETAALIVRWRAAGKPSGQADPADGPHGRGRGQARGFDHRPVRPDRAATAIITAAARST